MRKHIIKNFAELSSTALRRDALLILEAGLRAINVRKAVEKLCELKGSKLKIGKKSWNLDAYDHIYVVGVGKASLEGARALEKILGDKISGGIALDIKKGSLKIMKSFVVSHPFPSAENMRATGEIISLLQTVDSRDLVIALISGGGSAMLCWPYKLKCDDLILLTKAMMAKGASIEQMNTVRKHLSEIQGGQMARLAFPATVIGLIFSDVPSDELGMVASGPTVMDATTVSDARAILDHYDLLKSCNIPNCELRETPKDPIYFKKVTNLLMLSNKNALAAMGREAVKLKYKVRIYSKTVSGEAKDVGRLLAKLPKKGEVILAGGETTVTVKGSGVGGRNQEVVLGGLPYLEKNEVLISCASDGIDNSPAAGALGDNVTLDLAKRKGLNIKKTLQQNDSFSFFKTVNQHIITGNTDTNVSDLMLAIRARS